jgi:DNA repair exonuclease SbcCD nuclease subunit
VTLKVAIINDTHFGARNDNPIFLEHFMLFWEDVFFPYLKANNIRHIIHLGDLMDRRKYVNFQTLNVVRKRFVKPLNDMAITMDVILGNHDVFFKNTNNINSVKELFQWSELCDNWRIHYKPTIVEFGGTKIGFVPWITKDNEQECLDFIAAKESSILMGHFELSGYEVLRGVQHHDGMDPGLLSAYDAVYSGHFHCKHSKDNVHYLGTQYQITFSDLKETKGFHVLDTETGELEYIHNPHRLFTAFNYNDDDGRDFFDGSVDWNCYKETYVRLVIEKKINPFMLDRVIEKLNESGCHSITVNDQTSIDRGSKLEEKVDLSKDTLTLICEEIDRMDGIEDPTRLKNLIRELYVEAQTV